MLGVRDRGAELVEVVELGVRLALDAVGGGRGHDPDLGLGARKRLLDVEPRLDERGGIEHAPHLPAPEEIAEDGAVQRRDHPAQETSPGATSIVIAASPTPTPQTP